MRGVEFERIEVQWRQVTSHTSFLARPQLKASYVLGLKNNGIALHTFVSKSEEGEIETTRESKCFVFSADNVPS